MDKKTRNIVIAVAALVVVALVIWLIAGGAKQPAAPVATEAPAVTEAATEAPTEAPAEEATEAPAEEATEAPAEEATEAPAEEAATEAPAEEVKEAEAKTEEKTEEKAEEAKAAEEKTEVKAEVVNNAAETEAPTEEPTEAPTEEPTEAPTEEPTEAPTEEPTEAPTEEPTEAPTEEPTEAPTEEPTEAPTEEPTEAPTEEPTEAPAEEVKNAGEKAGDAKEEASATENKIEDSSDLGKADETGVAVIRPRPMTVNGKMTLNKEFISQLAQSLFPKNEKRLAKIDSMVDFVNGLEYKVLFDGVDGEAFISMKGEDLVSYLMLGGTDSVTFMTDIFPSYSLTVTKDDVAAVMPKENAGLDPRKVAEAFQGPLKQLLGGFKFGQTEKVEETIYDIAFTSRTPIDMTTKELGLLGLKAVKALLDNKNVVSVLNQLKAKGINIPAEMIDQLIEAVQNAKEEDIPELNAAIYTNEKNDMLFVARFMKDGKEIMHSMGGAINGEGISEYQMGDQIYSQVKVGKNGVTSTVRIMGMEAQVSVVPENRENGKALVETVTLMNQEVMKAEIEVINDATLTGKFVTSGKTELTVKDLKEKGKALIKDLRKDMALNYKPALLEKLKKVAPEMVSIFTRVKTLVKQAAPDAVKKLQPQN